MSLHPSYTQRIAVYTFNTQYPLCIIFGNNDRETYNIWFQRHPIIINYIVARYHNDETEWEKKSNQMTIYTTVYFKNYKFSSCIRINNKLL